MHTYEITASTTSTWEETVSETQIYVGQHGSAKLTKSGAKTVISEK